MRLKCHGCAKTIQVRRTPPAGARIQVPCPECGAVNRFRVPTLVERLSDTQKLFMDMIRDVTKGGK